MVNRYVSPTLSADSNGSTIMKFIGGGINSRNALARFIHSEMKSDVRVFSLIYTFSRLKVSQIYSVRSNRCYFDDSRLDEASKFNWAVESAHREIYTRSLRLYNMQGTGRVISYDLKNKLLFWTGKVIKFDLKSKLLISTVFLIFWHEC
jgi:hypothetical protein